MKTSELTGAALDWAVAKCEGLTYWDDDRLCFANEPHGEDFEPSTNWAQGGAIIEREGIAIDCQRCNGMVDGWVSCNEVAGDDNWDSNVHQGSTPLIAAMRCYVASKLGDEIDVPKEIMQ
jgi:hypothetical protein